MTLLSDPWTWTHTAALIVGWAGGVVSTVIALAWQDRRQDRRQDRKRNKR